MINIIFYSIIIFLIIIDFTIYLGYPFGIHFSKPRRNLRPHLFSDSQVFYHIIPLFNEENVIEEKILNCLQIQCAKKITHVFVLDHSSDGTAKIIEQYSLKYPNNIVFIDKGVRKGKNDSLNKAVIYCNPEEDDLLFFSDANTMFEPDTFVKLIDELAKGYGLVGGSMKYTDEISGSAKAEGLYWKYEEWIRRNEAKVGRCIVVNGGNFVMLAKYFKELPPFVPNDFEAPLRLVGAGIPVGFCFEAKGLEAAVMDTDEETSRKRRMANRQMNCIQYLWAELRLSTKIQVVSRKVLRWCGFHILLTALILSIVVYIIKPNVTNSLLASGGTIVLLFFVMNVILNKVGVHYKVTATIYHLIAVHYNSFKGMISSMSGEKVSIWEKAKSNR